MTRPPTKLDKFAFVALLIVCPLAVVGLAVMMAGVAGEFRRR